MFPECEVWRCSPLTRSSIAQVVRIRDLVRRDDPRPERAEGVDRLAEAEDARAHLAPLDVAGGDVVEDHVAADVVGGLLGREPLARLRRSPRPARARSRAPPSGARDRRPGRRGRRSRRRSGRRRSTARSRATTRRSSTPPRARGSCRQCGRTSSARSAPAAARRRAATRSPARPPRRARTTPAS